MEAIKEAVYCVWPLAIALWCLINSFEIARLKRQVVDDREDSSDEPDGSHRKPSRRHERIDKSRMVDGEHPGAYPQPTGPAEQPANGQARDGGEEPPEVPQPGAQLGARVPEGAGRLGEGLSANLDHGCEATPIVDGNQEPEGPGREAAMRLHVDDDDLKRAVAKKDD